METLILEAKRIGQKEGLSEVYLSTDGQIFTNKSLAKLHETQSGKAFETVEIEKDQDEVSTAPKSEKVAKAKSKATASEDAAKAAAEAKVAEDAAKAEAEAKAAEDAAKADTKNSKK